MEGVLDSSPNFFKVEFGVDGDGYDPSKETACIFLVTTPIGSQTFGVILVITGNVEEIENDRYRLVTKNAVIEQRIISEKDESIPNSDLVNAIESIEKQYDSEFSVVTMFDKSVNKGIKPDS